MVRQAVLFPFSLCCLVASVASFSVGGLPARAAAVASRPFVTRLYAEEEEPLENAEEEAPPLSDDHVLPSESASDILSSPAFLRRKIDVLKADIAKADSELEELNALVAQGKAEWGQQIDDLRLEYSKIQERMTQQSKDGDGVATVQVVRRILEVLDNYDRAFGAVVAETDEEKEIEEAYKVTYDKIIDTFHELGVTEVKTVGTEFDYEVHQAVMQRASDDYEEGIVCEELQKGFVLGDNLIRAAMVSVAA